MKQYLSTFSILFFFIITSLAVAQDMPADAAKAYNEGNKFLKLGNYDDAVKQYNEALKIAKDYRIYYQLGITLKKQGKLEDAIDAFKNAIEVKKDFDIAYNGLGSTYFQIGKYEEAVDAFKKFADMTKQKSSKDKAKENLALALVKLDTC